MASAPGKVQGPPGIPCPMEPQSPALRCPQPAPRPRTLTDPVPASLCAYRLSSLEVQFAHTETPLGDPPPTPGPGHWG